MIKLSLTILLLIQVNLRPRLWPLKKTKIIKTIETIQLSRSMPSSFSRKTRLKIRSQETWVALSAVLASKKAIMATSIPKNYKTSGSVGYFNVNNLRNKGIRIRIKIRIRIRIRIRILYLIPRDLQEPDWDSTRFRMQGQCNEPGFCFLAKSSDLKNQRWSLENWLYYFGNWQDDSFYLFCIE